MIGIYSITNLENGYRYIGQSVDLEYRLLEYRGVFSSSQRPMRISETIYEVLKSSSIENFSFDILEECSKEDLDEREQYYISLYHTYAGDPQCRGYNKTLGGKGTLGALCSDELSAIRSQRMIGNKLNLGRTPTEEARLHMSQSAPKTHSEEHNKRVSETLRARGIRPNEEAVKNSKIATRERLKGNTILLGRKFVNNGKENRAIHSSELDQYLSEGWSLGRMRKGVNYG